MHILSSILWNLRKSVWNGLLEMHVHCCYKLLLVCYNSALLFLFQINLTVFLLLIGKYASKGMNWFSYFLRFYLCWNLNILNTPTAATKSSTGAAITSTRTMNATPTTSAIATSKSNTTTITATVPASTITRLTHLLIFHLCSIV